VIIGYLLLSVMVVLGVVAVVWSFRSRRTVARDSKRRAGPPPGLP